jgi:hypothetical protein
VNICLNELNVCFSSKSGWPAAVPCKAIRTLDSFRPLAFSLMEWGLPLQGPHGSHHIHTAGAGLRYWENKINLVESKENYIYLQLIRIVIQESTDSSNPENVLQGLTKWWLYF